MAEPKAWSLAALAEDAAAATDRFRRSRLNEPLEQYTRFFETFTPIFADLIDRLPSLADEENVRNAMADPGPIRSPTMTSGPVSDTCGRRVGFADRDNPG